MNPSEKELLPATAPQLSELLQWAADCNSRDIPEEVYLRAAVVLFDNLAAMISARNDPVLEKLHEQLLSDGGRPVATVFRGGRSRTDRYSAAWANGAAAPWNELDEGSLRVSCHSGIYVLPALLAEAEAEGLSGWEVLRSLIIAYEVVTRIALCFQQPGLTLHPHAAFAAIGASAGIASIRRYDKQQFFSTITAAATMVNPGPFDHAVQGSFVRNLWVANASWLGLKSADWIQCGVSGLPEGPRNVFTEIFGFECQPEYLTVDLGNDWLITQNFQKLYPCCQFSHSSIEAIHNLIPALPAGVQLSNCEEIRVEIHERGRLLNEYEPQTILSARFSIPHIVAVMAIHGKIDVNTLSVDSLKDPAVTELRKRVSLHHFVPELPAPNDRAARVCFVFANGEQYEAECLCANGSAEKPFPLDTIKQKIHGITETVYPNMSNVMEQVLKLDEAILSSSWAAIVSFISNQDS